MEPIITLSKNVVNSSYGDFHPPKKVVSGVGFQRLQIIVWEICSDS